MNAITATPVGHAAIVRAATVDLMVIGEISEELGLNGHKHDADCVPSSWVEWLGRQISETAGRLDHH